jgi:chitinase
MAFANTQDNGAIIVDKMPTQLIKNWQQRGKRVLISIGGENGRWAPLFAHPRTFVESIASIIEANNLDGVDLDIEGYTTPPAIVASTITMLRQRLGNNRLIVVSPENVGIFPSQNVPV